MREPGIEPGPTPWQGAILPLDHSRFKGRVAQSVERRSDKAKVLGSSPSMTMTHFCKPAWRNGSASVSGAGGCGFDPHRGCFWRCPECVFLPALEPSNGTSVKIGTIQRRLAWSLRKDDTH
jgi:hypothetical protein